MHHGTDFADDAESLTLAKGFELDGWQMRRDYLSPCWTTRYADFPKVH